MNAVDHLVIAARALDEGVTWCEASLGIVPDAGGRHPSMGTHNRLVSIASTAFPRAYLEIIAIDPDAPAPGRARWFDLDTAAMQQAIAQGPQLVHWVMRCDDIDTRCARWRSAGVERGDVIDAQRDTAQGLLRWRISVRGDGRRLFDGALPTLIQWGARHPCDTLADDGVALQGLQVSGVPRSIGGDCAVPGVVLADAGSPLVVELSSPRGAVMLRAPRVEDADVQS